MNRFLNRLFFVAMLLCGFHGSQAGVRSHGNWDNGQENGSPRLKSRIGAKDIQEQIRTNDGWMRQMAEEPQSPIEPSLFSTTSSRRVISSRPTRILPTHGGRANHHHGRWMTDGIFNYCNSLPLLQCHGFISQNWASASPRLYYVIALRRLLC